MYADDVVLLATDPKTLQLMIDEVVRYCEMWNLSVNLEKTKVMVFRNGGKLARNEKWKMGTHALQTVNYYNYLGLGLTPLLNFKKHFSVKLENAKFALNTTYSNLMKKTDIPISKKINVFNAAVRTIMCYAGQVWGFLSFKEIEKLNLFFVRKLFCLPVNAPHYILYLESNFYPIFCYTLNLHLNYIKKVLALPEGRLPKALAEEVIKNRIYWHKENLELFGNLNISLDYVGVNPETVVASFKSKFKENMISKGQYSSFHSLYKHLVADLGEGHYISDTTSFGLMKVIFKLRGQLVNLNYNVMRSEEQWSCTLCNLGEREDMCHYLGKCPVLQEYRIRWLGKKALSQAEIINLLNSGNWTNLFCFHVSAYKYRMFLISEYNT